MFNSTMSFCYICSTFQFRKSIRTLDYIENLGPTLAKGKSFSAISPIKEIICKQNNWIDDLLQARSAFTVFICTASSFIHKHNIFIFPFSFFCLYQSLTYVETLLASSHLLSLIHRVSFSPEENILICKPPPRTPSIQYRIMP